MVTGSSLEFSGTLAGDESTFLIVNSKIESVEDSILLAKTDDTVVIPRPPVTTSGLRQVTEICAGIGCMGWGMRAADFQIVLRVDHNTKMNLFSQQLDGVPTIEGDICDITTMVKICETAPSAGILTSGVACQPYSKLGDKQMQHDSRAQTLPSSLRIGFLTRKAVILLECVDAAYTCKWVQDMIQQFVRQTHYHCSQGLLHLQDVWPARRSRWWCLLVHPSIGPIPWKAFPIVQPKPMVIHVLESFLHCNQDELRFLELDKYEIGKFSIKGLERNMIQKTSQMNTSLHSCGSQLFSCPCGCRKHPFTEHRLSEAGLHGLLVQVGSASELSDASRIRHVHPCELSLLNGMQPGANWGKPSQYKMALCGLGQLASPLQSAWLAAHIRVGLARFNLWQANPPTPNETLKYLMQQLLLERDQVFGNPQHPSTVFFNRMVWGEVDNFVLPNPFAEPKLQHQQIAIETKQEQSETAIPSNEVVPPDGESGLDGLDNLILQACTAEQFQTTEAFHKGAVAGFEVKQQHAMPPAKKQKVDDPMHVHQSVPLQNKIAVVKEPIGGNPQEIKHDPISTTQLDDDGFGNNEAEDLNEKFPPQSSEQPHCVVHVAYPRAAIVPVVVPVGTTASNITLAEEKLGTMTRPIAATTAMGEYVKQLDQVKPDQFLVLHDGSKTPTHFGLKCPKTGSSKPPELCHDKRDILLWQQLGWVAIDEMNFYLQMVGEHSKDSYHAALDIPIEMTDPGLVAQFVLDLAHQMHNAQVKSVGSAVLYQQHWSPIAVVSTGDSFEIHTTSCFAKELEYWCFVAWQEKSVPIITHDIMCVFPADCGFQTVGWLTRLIDNQTHEIDGQVAGEWRGRFHRFMEEQGIAETFVSSPIKLGGMAVLDDLQRMLQDHGVKANRSRECADMLMQKIGSSSIQHIMKSPKPWADLKARTNALSPPVRIVTSDELQEMIKTKVQQGGSLGRKSNKAKANNKKEQDHFHLRADQIAVASSRFSSGWWYGTATDSS